MTWSDIKLELGKKLGDPSGVKFGGILKNSFRSAYNQYVPNAPLEQLYLLQTPASVSFQEKQGSYTIPKSILFINISAQDYSVDNKRKRFIQVTDSEYSMSVDNPIMQPTSKEVKWFRDNNKIRLLSDNSILKFKLNYLPDFNFDSIDNLISDDAIAVVMDMVVNSLIPKKVSKDEYTNTNK